MELRAADFEGFFRAVHGSGPFPWQQDLVDRLAECGEWPDVLDLPTGAGKTAAMDAAVFHLALCADTPGRAALRIALVVDRRLVVDDAFERARKIAKALDRAPCDDVEGHEVIEEVARRLRRLAGDGASPLVARRLRGGAPLEHDWARTPTQPTILCSTVDQIGSRLLFRGYGVSDRMKPVHAGLLGANSLILLDEAHLSEPFRQTIDAVQCRGGATVRLALLSATPGAGATRSLELSPADRTHPILKKRLEARKPVTLKPVRGKPEAIAKDFAEAARTMAERLRENGVSAPAVGVVVNRVALARDVFNALKAEAGVDAMLMIGRSRDVGRNRIVEKLTPFRTGGEDRSQAEPLFIVATQCLEVGVDLDLDGLVTQAASLDALRQRFGRLNRAGRQIPAEGAILACAEDVARKADDPVYGDRIRLTWEALQGIAEGGTTVDFGVEALPKRLEEAGIDHDGSRGETVETLRSSCRPISTSGRRPHRGRRPTRRSDCSCTAAERTAAGVSLVWRGDVAEDDLKNARWDGIEELLRLVPPRASEAVDTPLWAARAWLRRVPRDAASLDAMSDAPEREAETPVTPANQAGGRPAFRWAGPGDARTGLVWPDGLQPGDMLIVPAGYGGCDQFGWAPDYTDPVEDVADEAARSFWGRRCAVRVARDVVQTETQWDRLSTILADESIAPSDLSERLLDALSSAGAGEASDERIDNSSLRDARKPLEALRRSRGRIDLHFPYTGGREEGAVLVAERGIELAEGQIEDAAHALVDAASTTEDDNLSHTSKNPVSLEDHGHRVACFTKRFAETLGLEEVADDLRLAAYLHDAGKADRRFQLMLSGGDPWNRPDGPPLAKSGRSWSPGAGKRAGLPEGWRHEALSVRMAPSHPRFADAHDPALVLWLIGSHHGLGRPFFDFLDPTPDQEPRRCLGVADWRLATGKPGPQSLAFEFRGADWPSLFEDLKRRYGIWGLAHLEAILRLADHRASEEERAL